MDVRTTGLSRPIWWCALLMLVANDHLLKSAHVLPSALTGKLSDIAGLIVAPVLVASLLGGSTRRRALAFALVAIPFAAINVSVEVASAVETITAAIGVPWRIWTDPSDLWALLVLPFAWRLCEPRRVTVDLRRPAIVLGSIACVATSMPIGPSTQAFIVNHTGVSQTVRVRFLAADIDCDRVAERLPEALSRDLFRDGTSFELEPNRVLALNQGAFDPACDAVLLNIDGLSETIAFWRDVPTREVPDTIGRDEELPGGAIELLSTGPDPRIETHEVTLVDTLDRVPGTCAHGSSYEWSTSFATEVMREWRMGSTESTIDGCLRIELVDPDTEFRETLFACLPAWAFPFEADEVVQLEATDVDMHVIGESGELRVDQMTESTRYWGHRARLEPGECGSRSACGAYVVPAVLDFGGELVTHEQSAEIVDGDARFTVGLGRAEHVYAAAPGCEPGRELAGEYGEVVVLREEME